MRTLIAVVVPVLRVASYAALPAAAEKKADKPVVVPATPARNRGTTRHAHR
jgi:hypothetical protein